MPEKTLEERIWEQLRLCYDHEIPVNIADLGLIYNVKLLDLEDGKEVLIQMTFTSPMCPMGDIIKQDVVQRVAALTGVKKVSIEIVWDPPWDQSRLSEAAKLQLGLL